MRDVGIVVSNQTGNNPGDTLTADLSQRIKGRNPNVIELLFLNHFLESGDALLRPATTEGSRAEGSYFNK